MPPLDGIPKPRREWRVLAISLALILLLSWMSSLLVQFSRDWYDALAKPDFTPPALAFAIVWPTLYVMMTLSAWLVWRRRYIEDVRPALGFFAVQLAANFAWTPLFFGMQSPTFGFAWLIVVWLLAAATLLLFRRYSLLCAALLVPYLAWLSFAGLLTYHIWRMN